VVWVVSSSHLLDSPSKESKEGYENTISSEPKIPQGVLPTRLDIQAMPNSSIPNQLPFGPYLQTASVGSYQYQDPATMPAELKQMTNLFEDLRSFLVFEGPSISDSSDPTVQLPLTQLRADSRKLEQEITVLENNSGIQSSLTQQNIADIQGALVFLQRKVRLFQTAGVVSNGVEGFEDVPKAPKTRATKGDLLELQTKVYAAILTLSSSGTKDPVVQARIQRLQNMYSSVSDMISKLDKGIWTNENVPVFKEDIVNVLPNLADPQSNVMDIFSQGSGKKLSPVQKQLAAYVGEENAESVFNSIKDNGMFRVSVDLGYNVNGSAKPTKYSRKMEINSGESKMKMSLPFDSETPGIEKRDEVKSIQSSENNGTDYMNPSVSNRPGELDWKKRGTSICEQARLRGFDPEDFGCIREGSTMSPAYSWRGHTKMVCGRLGATLDADLPTMCGCPPSNWKGWSS